METLIKELVSAGHKGADLYEKVFEAHPDAEQAVVLACESKSLKVKAATEKAATEQAKSNEEAKVKAMVAKEVESALDAAQPAQEKGIITGKAVAGESSYKKDINDFFRATYKKDFQRAQNIAASMKTITGTATANGEFLAPEEFNNEVFSLALEENMVYNSASRVSISSDTMNAPHRGHAAFTLKAQGATLDTSEATIRNNQLVLKKYGCVAYVSNELVEDSNVDISSMISGSFADGLANNIHNKLFVGAGTGEIAGISGYTGIGSVAQADTSAANKLAYSDLLKLAAQVSTPYIPSSVWVMNGATFFGLVLTLTDAFGNPIVKQDLDGNYRILGRTVQLNDQIPSDTTVGGVSDTSEIFFGAPNQIFLAEKAGGLRIDMSSDAAFADDSAAFRGFYRWDYCLKNTHAWAKLTTVK